MRRSFRSLIVSLLAAAGLVAVTVFSAAAGPDQGGARLTASPSGNPLGMSNSKNGVAVLSAGGMLPGAAPDVGTVTIDNTGSVDGIFSLEQKNLRDTIGPNGGALSSTLDLRINDVTTPASPVRLYQGKLGAMGQVALGEFRKRTGRTYMVSMAFPDGGVPPSPTTGDNRFQGSSVRTDLVWTETKASGNGPKGPKDKDTIEVKDVKSAGDTPGTVGDSASGGSGGGGSGGGGNLPFTGLGLAGLALAGAAAAASGLALRRRLR